MGVNMEQNDKVTGVQAQGISIGAALAMILSWDSWHVVWAIVHGLLSWIYVVYWLIWVRH